MMICEYINVIYTIPPVTPPACKPWGVSDVRRSSLIPLDRIAFFKGMQTLGTKDFTNKS